MKTWMLEMKRVIPDPDQEQTATRPSHQTGPKVDNQLIQWVKYLYDRPLVPEETQLDSEGLES